MPTLYVVATPIGNLEDISLRALRTLREAKLIAAEDTRKTRRLLDTYNIRTSVTSYYEHSRASKLDYILKTLADGDVALVSEAGTPGISDPGYKLIATARERDIPIVAIPGPSAIITALVVSGLPTDRFSYVGFLPRRSSGRRRFLRSVINESGTIVALETPHRLREALEDLLRILGDRRIAVCRQLTKLHEEVFRGTVSQAKQYFNKPRGEFTIVVEGKKNKERPKITDEILKQLKALKASGKTAKETLAEVSLRTGLSKKELYQAWLRL
ncbi:MAG: 16S rRNA (cytidine(1402)-2'-O)-methyltransferase [Dehalococcoidia bacterium]|nr:MAG: 16S rRNA (cytidine(1402)-2'-O)-methyltransferase [Dehalococcoidia bacterium]